MPNPRISDRESGRKRDSAYSENFNPYGLHSIHIPLELVPFQGISWGAKCLYGRLALFRGKKPDGFCAPDLGMLARAMGTSIDTVDRWLKELVQRGFVRRVRRGPNKPAECIFLPHSCLTDSATLRNQEETEPGIDSEEMRNQTDALIPQCCGSDSAELPNHDSATLRNAYKEENIHRENIHENIQSSSSESLDLFRESATSEASDDEVSFPRNSENRWWEANSEDREDFVDLRACELRAARAADANGKVTAAALRGVRTPDLTITVQILSQFASLDDFRYWLEDTIRRRVAKKAKADTYGLYLTDAHNCAEDLRRRREAQGLQAERFRIAQEREREEQERQQRIMATPCDPEAAIAEVGRAGQKVNEILRGLILRIGEPISPGEVIEKARTWRKCRTCGDTGVTGSALDRTLAVCECLAGVEVAHRNGADWCAREIGRINATLKTRLVAAAHDCGLYFTGDGIDESTVIDDGETIVIGVPKECMLMVAQRDLEKAIERLGLRRSLRIEKSGPRAA